MKKKIIFCGGGTLGHIMPIIPIVIDIYKDYDLYFIGTKKGNEEKYFYENKVNIYFKRLFFYDMVGINRKNIFKNIKTICKYITVKKEITQLYKTLKPDLVIGMGGYISGVAISIAYKNKIKTMIHEQNAILGLANKIVYKKVDKVLLSYDIKDLSSHNKHVIGNPRYSYVKDNFKVKDNNLIIIVSGSLGSDFINDLIIKNINDFLIDGYLIKLIVGKKYFKKNNEVITKINNNKNYNQKIQIHEFLNNIIEEMSRASLIISRCGATTISEIMALRKPSILIPSPNVTSNHQYFNALDLYTAGCCELIEEKEVTTEKIVSMIRQIITNYGYKKNIITNIDKKFTNDPKKEFIKLIKDEIC